MFCCVRPAASGVLFEDEDPELLANWLACKQQDMDWPAAAAPELLEKSVPKASRPMVKGGKKTMQMLVLDGTMETPAVTCRDIIPWMAPPASPWVLKAQACGVESWQGEDCLQGGLSVLEALALISSHHADDYLAEQQKAAANAELLGAWDYWLNAAEVFSSAGCKQQARRGWFGRVVLLLAVVLLFVRCIVAASDSSRLVSVMESGRTAAVSVVESAVSALDG